MKEKTVNFIEAKDVKGISLVTSAMVPGWVRNTVGAKYWVDDGENSTANGDYVYADENGDLMLESAVIFDAVFDNNPEINGVIPMVNLNEPLEPGTAFILNKTGFHVSDDPYVAVCDEAVTTSDYYQLYHGKKCKVTSSNIAAWLQGWINDQLATQEN